MKLINKIFLICFLGLLPLSACSAQKNELKQTKSGTRTFDFKRNVKGINATTVFDIVYTPGESSTKAVLTGPEELLSKINYRVDPQGILTFRLPKKLLNNSAGRITVQLSGPMYKSYSATSTGTLKIAGQIKTTDNINISVSSSGNITFDKGITANTIKIEGSSIGKIKIFGAVSAEKIVSEFSSNSSSAIASIDVKTLYIETSSTSRFQATKVNATNISLESSSGSEIVLNKCTATNLDAEVSSASNIELTSCNINKLVVDASSAANFTAAGKAGTGKFDASSVGKIKIKNLKVRKSIVETSSFGEVSK